MKMPLRCVLSVYTNSETAVPWAFRVLREGSLVALAVIVSATAATAPVLPWVRFVLRLRMRLRRRAIRRI